MAHSRWTQQHLFGRRGDRIVIDDPHVDRTNESWNRPPVEVTIRRSIRTGCSALAMATALPRPPVMFFGQSGGQLAQQWPDVSRWNDADSDPVADIQRWKDWIKGNTGRL